MEIDDKRLSKYEIDSLLLSLKIFRMRYLGDEPPKKLLDQAYVLGCSKIELNSLCCHGNLCRVFNDTGTRTRQTKI